MVQRKYKYWISPEGLTKVRGWAQRGLVDEQIAHNIGINVSTLYDWKKKYSEFDEALKRGKEIVDIEVENALLSKALGTKVTEVTREVNSKGKLEITKTVDKVITGDTTAMIFWLKNRRPDLWRDTRFQEVNAEVKGEITNPFEGMSKQELRKMLRDE